MLKTKQFVLNSVTAQIILMSCFMFTTGNAAEPVSNKIAVSNGQKIAFLGDSITAAGRRPGGYCQIRALRPHPCLPALAAINPIKCWRV